MLITVNNDLPHLFYDVVTVVLNVRDTQCFAHVPLAIVRTNTWIEYVQVTQVLRFSTGGVARSPRVVAVGACRWRSDCELFDEIVSLAMTDPRFLSAWDQSAWWTLPVEQYNPTVSLEGSALSGIRSGWNQGAKREQGTNMCVCWRVCWPMEHPETSLVRRILSGKLY